MLERQEASGNSPWAHTCWQKTFLGARYTTKRLISTRAILESSSCPVSIGSLFTHQLVGNNPGQPKPSSLLVEIQPYPPEGPEPGHQEVSTSPKTHWAPRPVTRSQPCSPVGQCQNGTPPRPPQTHLPVLWELSPT